MGKREERFAKSAVLKQAILADHRANLKIAEIAARNGVSEIYVWRVAKEAGIKPRVKVRRHTHDKNAILQAYMAGEKLDYIEVKFHVSRVQIYKWTPYRRSKQS